MRKIFILFTAIFLFLLDQTVLPFFSVFNSYGSILFVFFGLFAMMTDYEDAIILAIISGVLQDIFFPYAFGLNTLTNLFLYMGLSRVGLSLKEGRKTIPLLFITLAQAAKTVVILLILFLIGVRGNYFSIIITPIFAMIIGILIYRLVVAYSRIPIVKKEWRF
jgi:rod shape-determining protein MreD